MSLHGLYNGKTWIRLPHKEVFPYLDRPIRAEWYFPTNNGEPTGDHFRTLRELYAHLDAKQDDEEHASDLEWDAHWASSDAELS
jgi:hypothetical protein